MSDLAPSVPRVLIVGGGFGGLATARALAHEPVQVTVCDRLNYHLFQPLLYQVAMAGLAATDVATPIRSILQERNTTVLMAEVVRLNLANRFAELADGTSQSYDYLVVAAGAQTSYYGHDEWARFAPGLKDLDDALRDPQPGVAGDGGGRARPHPRGATAPADLRGDRRRTDRGRAGRGDRQICHATSSRAITATSVTSTPGWCCWRWPTGS